MHHLIASYLFQNKTCPLPGLGTLLMATTLAESDFANKIINAPAPVIAFETRENDASNLLDYIAAKTNSNVFQAIDKLGQLCNNLKAAAISNNPATLDGIGNFFTDSTGKICFKPLALPFSFFQPVKAARVIHPEAEHNILVGDKETTNTLMTEYFNEDIEEVPVKKDRWWIWVIILGAIALLALLLYVNGTGVSSMVGNVVPV
jgi:hypothetical protein